MLYSVGNLSRVNLARSTAGPAQALVILETGALDQFSCGDADKAHSSEDAHISQAACIVCKVQGREQGFQCRGHDFLSETVSVAGSSQHRPPPYKTTARQAHGIIGGAKALARYGEAYHLPEHPIWVGVQRAFSEPSDLGARDIKWGIGGRNSTRSALSVLNLARVYCGLGASADKADAYTFGADGCYGVSVRAWEQRNALEADGAIRFAVKVADRNIGVLYSLLVKILQQLGIKTAAI
ncbi:L-asparaginase II-domain-containing protein [Aspergillus desertorum]